MQDDYDVESWSQREAFREDDGSELALEPVALHGPLEPAARPDPHTSPYLIRPKRADGNQAASRPPSPSVYGPERLRECERRRGWYGVGALARCAQAGISCQRPFCRRRLSVLRPARVLIRWRNPWTRFRFKFDLFLRCFFMSARIGSRL